MTASTQFNYGRRNSNVTPYTIPTTNSKPHHNHSHHHHEQQQSPIMSNYQLHHHHHSYNPNNSRHNNNHNNTNHHQHHIHSHSHSQSSTPSSGQFISSPPLSASVPTLSREFVVRRISEGETGRLKEELRCEACGKGYKHISSLAKHLWEHTPEWNVTKKLLISKHQQVQLLEAASILVGMNENTNGNNGNNGMIQSQHQQAVQRHINQQHSKIKSSLADIHSNGGSGSPYSPPNSNNSTPSIINSDDHVLMNHEENLSILFKNGYHNSNNNGGEYEEDDDDEEEEEDDDDDTEDYDGQNRLNHGRLRSVSHEPPIYEKHEVTSPILESEQNNGNKYENSSNLKSPNSTNYLNTVKSELPVQTNFSVMNENKKETYVEESVIGTMEA